MWCHIITHTYRSQTAIAVEPAMSAALRAHAGADELAGEAAAFQLFGFDVMLDAGLRPWLLEVNLDPALQTDSPLDLRVKSELLVDTLNLVGIGAALEPTCSHGGATTAPARPAASPTDAAILRRVNAEFQRSRAGGWRRLLPSSRSSEFAAFVDGGGARRLHSLGFDGVTP